MSTFREIKPLKRGRKPSLQGAELRKFRYWVNYGASNKDLCEQFNMSLQTARNYKIKILNENNIGDFIHYPS